MHIFFFFFQAEDGIRDVAVTGVQTCALPISCARRRHIHRRRRRGAHAEAAGQEQHREPQRKESGHAHEARAHARPVNFKNAASSRISTPSRRASSALLPGASPTTTYEVFFDTELVTRPPSRSISSSEIGRASC